MTFLLIFSLSGTSSTGASPPNSTPNVPTMTLPAAISTLGSVSTASWISIALLASILMVLIRISRNLDALKRFWITSERTVSTSSPSQRRNPSGTMPSTPRQERSFSLWQSRPIQRPGWSSMSALSPTPINTTHSSLPTPPLHRLPKYTIWGSRMARERGNYDFAFLIGFHFLTNY